MSKTNYKSEYKLINKNELLECKLTDKEKLCIIVLDPKKVRMTEILDPKLMSQALHYLEGGEIFDTLGFAIDQGRVIIEMNILGSALAGMRRHDGIYNGSSEEYTMNNDQSVIPKLLPQDFT